MLYVLSPSKTLDYSEVSLPALTRPRFREEVGTLVEIMREKTVADLRHLMDINPEIAQTNRQRYLGFQPGRYSIKNAKPALLAFKGQVYHGLKAETLSWEDLEFAQDHIRVLSGLYGLLRPLDLMQPYRLEMGTQLENPAGNTLYQFWGDKIGGRLRTDFRGHKNKVLVNLASQEYFKAIDTEALGYPILDIQFKEYRNGSYKTIAVYAKTARGLMARYGIEHRVEHPETLKGFDYEGYHFNPELSKAWNWVFTREE